MRTRRAIRAALTVAIAAVAVTGLGMSTPAAAQTGTIVDANLNAGVLFVTAAPGKVNDIRVEQKGNRFIVSDAGDVVVGKGLCNPIPNNSHAVDCHTFNPIVHAGDLNDFVTFDNDVVPVGGTQIPAILFGDEGNDLVQATPLSWVVVLRGGPGNDTHRGGRGNDDLDGGPGPDGFYGGAGKDLVDYSSRATKVSANLDGLQNDGELNERDVIKTDVEGFRGGRGDDTLVGNDAANEIWGGAGRDTIFGLGGADVLGGVDISGDGDDSVFGGNGPDRLFGGAGNDSVSGGTGNDVIEGGSGSDRLLGEAGADQVNGRDGDVTDLVDGGADTTDTCSIDLIGGVADQTNQCEIVVQ